MQNKRSLWLFPIMTQGLFSLLLPFFNGFSLAGLGYVFLFASLPAFILAVCCVKYQFHQRNVLQLAFWSSVVGFVNSLVLLSLFLVIEQPQDSLSTWEHTFAVFFYALMFALASLLYAIVVLRLFLPSYAFVKNPS